MFLAGMKKGTICNQLKLNINTLNRWLGYQTINEFRRNKAIELIRNCESRETICKNLNLPEDIYRIYLNEYNNRFKAG